MNPPPHHHHFKLKRKFTRNPTLYAKKHSHQLHKAFIVGQNPWIVKDPLKRTNICFLYRSLYLGVEKAFIHSETWRSRSRQAWDISNVYSLPFLQRAAFPPNHGFAILFPASHPLFCWGYFKSCLAQVTHSRISLKYFQICYYIRKRELKLLKSCQGICKVSANKAMCWLHTNWPITLLMMYSKQFRTSSQKAAWRFWINYSVTSWEENGLDAKRGNSNKLVIVQQLSYQPVTWPAPDFITDIFRKCWHYSATLTEWVNLYAKLWFGTTYS